MAIADDRSIFLKPPSGRQKRLGQKKPSPLIRPVFWSNRADMARRIGERREGSVQTHVETKESMRRIGRRHRSPLWLRSSRICRPTSVMFPLQEPMWRQWHLLWPARDPGERPRSARGGFRIIDQRAEPSPHSKAHGLQSRTLGGSRQTELARDHGRIECTRTPRTSSAADRRWLVPVYVFRRLRDSVPRSSIAWTVRPLVKRPPWGHPDFAWVGVAEAESRRDRGPDRVLVPYLFGRRYHGRIHHCGLLGRRQIDDATSGCPSGNSLPRAVDYNRRVLVCADRHHRIRAHFLGSSPSNAGSQLFGHPIR